MSEERRAIILAGGLGTRLRGVVNDAPKSLAPVCGRPFIEYLLIQLRSNGVSSVVVCAGYMGDVLSAHLGDGARWDMQLEYSVETEPLGTGGALKLAAPMLVGDTWLLMNGDSFFDIPLQRLFDAHSARPAMATIALARVAEAQRYGRVTVAPDGEITAFAEKTHAATPGLINSGLYIIERSLLDLIPADRPASLERDVIPLVIGSSLRGVSFDDYFIDIGVPEDYARAQTDEQFRRLATRLPD